MKTFPVFILFVFLFLKSIISVGQNNSDKILDAYYQATNTEFTIKNRIEASKNLLSLSKEKSVDSLMSKSYLLLCSLNSKQQQYDSAYYYCKKLIGFARQKKDTSLLVKGFFRKGFYLDKTFKTLKAFDAYTNGVAYAIAINDSVSTARMLTNMSIIQNNIGDFYGAQESATKGLVFLTKENNKSEYLLTNNLGIAFTNCKDYKNAEAAYLKLIKLSKTSQNKASALNNLANVYRKQEKYKKAIAVFSEALKDSATIDQASTINRLKDNLGYTLFQQTENNGLDLMLEAHRNRTLLDDYEGQFASNIHLINYYFQKDQKQSIRYTSQAIGIAKKLKSPDMHLEALSYLIKLQPTAIITTAYVLLNDSINNAKSLTQNKYAGILYKTEEKEIQNLKLKQLTAAQELKIEKENLRKWIFAIGLLTVIIIAFFIWRKYQAEAKAKRTISLQKDKIEKQKNRVEELQKELHHRLKNNFSMINFFIDLAKGKFKDKAYQEKLNELQNRIGSMFSIHTQLIKKEDITSVNAFTYISSLANKIEQVYDQPFIKLAISINENEVISTELSFPIGLIINEFVTNSYKYAFPDDKEGIIAIDFHSDTENYHLNISDNGIGLPDDFDINTLSSFGIDTIKLLSEQYHGKFQLNSAQGVQLKITLPKYSVGSVQ
ncbi:MAG: hypothetical protein COB12_08840 [Flavobacterium sp.]|nr:MAG: hypothetical protein COB12_08840 [Flavobacterium sp.]